ncbi:MAG: ATP-dependent DNA helicase RecG, partial [Candidatus Thioglobus sp.]
MLEEPIISIHGLGPKARDKLNAIGIYNLEHLLFHLPFRYQNKTNFGSLETASVGAEILLQLTIIDTQIVPSRTQQLLCHLADKNGRRLLLRFFHFNQHQREQLVRDDIIQCFGEIKIGKNGLEMHHPEYRLISKGQKTLLEKTLSPIYPLTGNIHQAQMKKWVDAALQALKNSNLTDNFAKIAADMPSLKQALMTLHHPQNDENLDEIAEFRHSAQQRLIIEELCAHRLSLLKLKRLRAGKTANVFTIKNTLCKQ